MTREADAARGADDPLLLAAYLAEFAPLPTEKDAVVLVGGVARRAGDLRALAVHDLAARVGDHHLLRRADDTARLAALTFVERRLAAGDKIAQYGREGAFAGFLRRVLHNLLLDWLRSPAGRAELHRKEHDPAFEAPEDVEEPPLPGELDERARALMRNHAITLALLRALPPGRGAPLRLSLWPAYEHDAEDVAAFQGFARCHETATSQADARGCDSGRRCELPDQPWREAYAAELDERKRLEPGGLSRRAIAEALRIGVGKPIDKREGAVCERISKARLMLVEELRRTGVESSRT